MSNPTAPPPPEMGADASQSVLTRAAYAQLEGLFVQTKSPQVLNAMLRNLAKWRSQVVANTIIKKSGSVVQSGPFQGMSYMATASEGAVATRLLGVYEASLHPIIEDICRSSYGQIIDVGCAEGYYAVGLARRLPSVRVLARDSNAIARQKCAELASLNGVAGQVEIGGLFAHDDFDICKIMKTLVICDIEGGEDVLLDPNLAPGLLGADILVEVHDCFAPGLSDRLAQRFSSTHDVRTIHRSLASSALPAWMEAFSDLDRLIALWEWRAGPTPWLWMTAKTA